MSLSARCTGVAVTVEDNPRLPELGQIAMLLLLLRFGAAVLRPQKIVQEVKGLSTCGRRCRLRLLWMMMVVSLRKRCWWNPHEGSQTAPPSLWPHVTWGCFQDRVFQLLFTGSGAT
jgi:hypothetical protein